MKTLTYCRCFCCNKNYNVSKLIEINSSSVTIGDENLSFTNLFLDVCLHMIDESKINYLCEQCKDQLVQFHIFKREIIQYSNIQEHLQMQEILYNIKKELNDFNLTEVTIHRSNDSVTISKINCEYIEEHLSEEIIVDEGQKNDNDDIQMEVNVEELETFEEIEELTETQNDTSDSLKIEEISSKAVNSKRKKYKYKINTNEHLQPEQIEWIQDQVKNSEITINNQKAFKCQICGTVLRILSTLKKHLRDCHVLKSDRELELRENRKEFRDEVNRCRMQIQTSSGIETFWKCERCKVNKIFKSEAGFKVHLRYNHIRNQVINSDFIAKCKVIVKKENGEMKPGWKCIDCNKILLSRDGLRYHLKLEHTDTVEALNSNQRVSVDEEKPQSESLLDFLNTKRKQPTSSSSAYLCEQCGIKFVNGTTKKEKSSEIHQQLHTILKVVSQSYELPKCDECKVMFSNNEELGAHLLTHNIDEVYPAEGMSFLVAIKYKESEGTSLTHDHNSWKCGHCTNVNFTDETDCIEHQMILHSKQLICPFDYLEFNGIRGLGQFCTHMKNKHPEMFPQLSITCSYCGEEFHNVFDKLIHMKNCETKKFHCDHCQKSFFRKNQLIRHLKIVSGEISFACDLCNKKCVSTMDLKLHYRKHTNEKSYQCTFPNCLKFFKTPAHRSSHLEIHSNIEYECTDCKAIFKQRALLQRHLKRACKSLKAK